MMISLQQKVVDRLIELGYHISFAESCTGGMCCASLVDVSNASRVLDASFVTYANSAKVKYLGVDERAISDFGVVSEPVVDQMCRGVAAQTGANVGVAVSGVAGPTGGTDAKPVGTVCFGFYIDGTVHTFTEHFGPIGRNNVRASSVMFVFSTLDRLLNNT